ncbi:MAG: hypothetical protein CL610_28095 [Anaerolineaceae bacterium]|nr:hypothetical protein [Anaerolineaceae bacterium]
MRTRFIWMMGMVLLLTALPVWAKGQSDRIVLTGPTIDGEVIVSNPQMVALLSMGRLEDFNQRVDQPALTEDAPYYELERQYEIPAGRFQTFDRVRYYPVEGTQPSYIHYLGIVNGSSEYDNRWFMARPQARVAFETLFDSAAQPYIALMRASGQITFADPVTLEDVAVIEAFEYERPLSGFVDSADVDTFYMEAEQAGFTETYRVNLATGTVCPVDVLPPSAGFMTGSLWIAGLMAENVARQEAMTGTWLEGIDVFGDGLVLLHHPLGRYHAYDYGAEDRGQLDGGILVYAQDDNQLVDQWQPDIGFAQVIAGDNTLYAVAAPRHDTAVTLYALDSYSGEIIGTRQLDEDRWSVGYGVLDLSALDGEPLKLNVQYQCQLDAWEVAQMFRYPMSFTAASQ